ncbi:CHAP domain-containing protein [Chryseobacterium sp. FH2]|uniref:CHAP domain-containing protein n=1 Tax=Chryseobacterium sp. FH2 TaxID=1674291 RepID=UPI00065AF9D6|nr:CHAP domain-containing protein [Chryseobacterium sp. FH2]
MAKQGVLKITGNPSPKVGEKTTYSVVEWYPATPKESRNPALVTWELFKKRSNGKFTSTNIKKKGDGTFTFGEVAHKYTYRLEAYLHDPEGKGPMTIEINPQANAVPKINKVELHYIDDSKGSVFSYTEKLVAKAHTVNLSNKELLFTLWEDDAKGEGHNTGNLFVDAKKGTVNKDGLAQVDFMLTKALMQKAVQGEADPKELEFYVTVEYYQDKKHATGNVDVKNPDYKPPVQQSKPQAPAQKPKTAQPAAPPKAQGSPAEKKPQSKKEEKGLWDTMTDWLWDWGESKGTVKPEKKPTQQKPEGKTETVVKTEQKSAPGECYCKKKENEFYWSNKLTCKQRKKVLEVCASLWGEDKKAQKASELMSVMHLETAATFDPSKDNGAGYSGLIQFSDASAKSVGSTRAELRKMTFIEQMDYVKKYFEKKKDSLNTMTDLYLLVLKQNAVGQGGNPDYVLFDESVSVPDEPYNVNNLSKEPWVTKYGYSSNPAFMREEGEFANKRQFKSYSKGLISRRGFENGKTYVWEVTDVLTKEHYNLGVGHVFKETCEDKPEEKKKVTGTRAPWMTTVMAEAKNYGGYDEGDDPLNARIKGEYFSIKNEFTTNKTDPTSISWCAAFASWCLQKAGYANPSSCRALEFNPAYMHDGPDKPDRPSGMRKITKPTYGCIVVWKNKKGGGGHVGFHYGYESNGNIVPIGGNQGSSLKFSSRSPDGDYGQTIVGYFLPEDYEDNAADEFTADEKKLDPKALNKSDLLKKSNEEISGKTT